MNDAAALQDIGTRLDRLEQRSRCQDLRARWERAVAEKHFYQTLMRIFTVAALGFIVGSIVLFYLNQTLANAGIGFISGIVSGLLAGYFRTERDSAERKEAERWTEYNTACPDDAAASRAGRAP